MASVEVRRVDGSTARSVELDGAIFGIEPNGPVMHQVVTSQLAAARAGSHSTKRRSEVAGGGAKPWRQKGTGRSRQGSIRSPQWVGGGVAHGPKPRSYKQKTPKKMVRLALRSALSDRAAAGRVAVVEGWDFPGPRTKDARAALDALGVEGRVVVVVGDDDDVAYKSFRNLPEVHLLPASELNTYDILTSDWIVFSLQTLPVAAAPSPTGDEQADGSREDPAEKAEVPEEQAVVSTGEGQVPEESTPPPAPMGETQPAEGEG